MITLETEQGRFSYRVAGIAILDGHVLLHRGIGDQVWVLPGGRAELMEEAGHTLKREMLEETGLTVTVGRLVWFVENFFFYGHARNHEIGLYFEMTLPYKSLHPEQMTFIGHEGMEELEFRWVPLAGLTVVNLQPRFLIHGLINFPRSTEHIVLSAVSR